MYMWEQIPGQPYRTPMTFYTVIYFVSTGWCSTAVCPNRLCSNVKDAGAGDNSSFKDWTNWQCLQNEKYVCTIIEAHFVWHIIIGNNLPSSQILGLDLLRDHQGKVTVLKSHSSTKNNHFIPSFPH